MPGGFRFTIEERWKYKGRTGGDVLFDEAIVDINNTLGDFSPAFHMIADEIFEPRTLARFRSEGADVFEGWQQLAKSTVKRRGSAHPILEVDGALRDSFKKLGASHVENISEKVMEWGSANPYAIFHQTGTGKGLAHARVATGKGTGRGMAMRKMVFISDEDKQRMREVLTGRLSQELTRAGYGMARSAYGPGEAGTLSPGEARGVAGGAGADLISGM